MTLSRLLGQPSATATLTRALESGRAHHAYRFEGPDGTGKELAAFAFAQAFMCTARPSDAPFFGCGTCNACRRTVTLSETAPHVPLHPDVVLVQRGLYADVLKDAGGKGLAEKMGISIEQIRRVVLAQVGFAPNEGRARVFIFRDAHDLTTSAANALLKTLEEPRPSTHFILLTSRPDKLLPTIRSRTMPVRFAPLPEDVVRSLLAQRAVPASVLEDAVSLCEGSVSAALAATDEELSARRKAFIEGALKAAATRNPARATAFLETTDFDRSGARHELLGLASHLDRTARKIASTDPHGAAALSRGFGAVIAVIDELEVANAGPLLALTRLLIQLGRCGAARAALSAAA